MKSKKSQENEEPMVCEPAASYTPSSARQPNAVSKPYSEDMGELMSVEEYFDKLWSAVELKYENLQS
ncbi:MAG: hypothetical protein J6T86_09760 [Bacteroidales bacterium]|nr:hypothetical protein [Bacteroidales bacterium]